MIHEEVEKGRTQSEIDIASGSPKLYWQTRGGWGRLFTQLFADRFGVTVEHISDITWDAKISYQCGYNDATRKYIDRTFGADAYQKVLDEVEEYRRKMYEQHFGKPRS